MRLLHHRGDGLTEVIEAEVVALLRVDSRPAAEGHEVVRPARLRAGADRGALPAAEGLALNDRAGDAAVDIQVACLHSFVPQLDLVRVQ